MKQNARPWLGVRAIALALCLLLCASAFPAFAEQPHVVRVGFFRFDGYHMLDADGRRSGYGYEYLQHIARYTDWTYQYVGYDKGWSDMLAMLDDGEIDLVTSARITPEREEKYAYSSRSIGTSATMLTVKAGDRRYYGQAPETWSGMRVGMLLGNSRNDSFAQYASEHGFRYEPVFFDSSDELERALQEGDRIDASVTSSFRGFANEWVMAQFDVAPIYVIVRKDDAALLEQLNNALEQVDTREAGLQNELRDRYYGTDRGNVIAFTLPENEYLQRLATEGIALNALIRANQPPLFGISEDAAKGIVSDIARELERRTGLKLNLIPVVTREEYLRLLADESTAIVLDFDDDFNTAEQNGYKLTNPFLSVGYAAIRRRNRPLNDERIAALLDERINTMLAATKDVRMFDSAKQCAAALLSGDCDVCYVNTYLAECIVRDDETNQLIASDIGSYRTRLCIGVRTTQPTVLLSILNKGVDSLDAETIDEIVTRATDSGERALTLESYLYTYPVLSVAILLIACALIVTAIIAVNSQRRRKDELKRSNEYVRFIDYVCKSNDEVSEIDTVGHVRYLYHMENGRVERDSIPFESIEEILSAVHPDDREMFRGYCTRERLDRLISARDEIYLEARLKMADESYHWFAYTLQGMARDGEHPGNLMLYKRDVDKLKGEEERQRQLLRDALLVAERSNEAKGGFMSRMSHEIRTPLNAVIGYMTIAKNAGTNLDKVHNCMVKAELAAKHLLSIINDVLDLSSIESGKLKIAHDRFDLKQLLSTVTSIFYAQAKAKGIRLEIGARGLDSEEVVGDALRLKQVLLNLLSNAVKFTPEGGSVRLNVWQTTRNEDKVYLRFAVADTGIGISDAFKAKLFQPFEQQDASISLNFGGTGLGMSITKNLVTLMRGTINVESEQGKGTTFLVELPFGAVRAGARPCFPQARAMIVSDNADERETARLLLDDCGVESVGCTPDEAETACANEAFTLCLLDWQQSAALANSLRDKLTVIAMGYDVTEFEDDARAAGAVDVLSKPLFRSTVAEALTKLYGRTDEMPEAAQETTFDFKGKHLLLAEDNDMNLEIALELLTEAGFSVDTARNGEEAVQAYEGKPDGAYDAILMDVMMPLLNGYDATKRIRQSDHPHAKEQIIIAMTANAFAEDVAQSMAAGMNGHVSKPIDIRQLYAELARLIPKEESR